MEVRALTDPQPQTPGKSNVKRFRNGSSPFRALSFSTSDVSPVWEWRSANGKWFPYSPDKADLLENSLCSTERILLPGSVRYEVDLRRFIQLNVDSGKERSVRRRLMNGANSSKTGYPAVNSPCYDGRSVLLNKLSGQENVKGSGITFSDILSPSDGIESALLSSYGTDIEWLLKYFQEGTPITLVDQPPSQEHQASMFPLGNIWPNFQLIHPKFEKGGLFESGTMHCKLILIRFKSGKLRICISSANLVEFDWNGITQVFWIVDIEREKKADSQSSFGQDLTQFVERLLGDNTLITDWVSILKEYEDAISSQVPTNVHLVVSVPGTHARDKLYRYGQMRLRKLLQEYRSQTVIFQMSSLGQLQKPFMESLMQSFRTTQEQFHIVWPEYQTAMQTAGKDHMILYEKNLSGAQRFLTPLIALPGRSHALHHSKIILGSDQFAYIGSHNLSMSAWGRLVYEDSALQIASYELGVLFTDIRGDSAIQIRAPFDLSEIGKPIREAWIYDAFMNRVNYGTERLHASDLDRIKSTEKKSLADFLSMHHGETLGVFIDDLSSQIVSEYVSKSASIPVFNFVMTGSTDPTDYGHHIMAFYDILTLPCLVVHSADGDTLKKHSGIEILEFDFPEKKLREQYPQTFAIQFIKDNGITLLCLDVDGTIVESNKSSVLMPSFVAFLNQLSPSVRIALVTNQGGVGLRHWMTSGSFGDPSSLPSQEEVEGRILAISEKISSFFSGPLATFMAFRYQSKGDASNGKAPRWGPVPLSAKDDPRWKQEWRKPSSGMLAEAMKWAGISIFNKSCALMVGDMDTDEGAAKGAGIKFQRAPDFFTRSS